MKEGLKIFLGYITHPGSGLNTKAKRDYPRIQKVPFVTRNKESEIKLIILYQFGKNSLKQRIKNKQKQTTTTTK